MGYWWESNEGPSNIISRTGHCIGARPSRTIGLWCQVFRKFRCSLRPARRPVRKRSIVRRPKSIFVQKRKCMSGVRKWVDYVVGNPQLFVKTTGCPPGIGARRARTFGVAFLESLSVQVTLVAMVTDPFLPPNRDRSREEKRGESVSLVRRDGYMRKRTDRMCMLLPCLEYHLAPSSLFPHRCMLRSPDSYIVDSVEIREHISSDRQRH